MNFLEDGHFGKNLLDKWATSYVPLRIFSSPFIQCFSLKWWLCLQRRTLMIQIIHKKCTWKNKCNISCKNIYLWIFKTFWSIKSSWNIFDRSSYMSVFSHFLLVLNSSTNIIIYSWKDKKFRTVLKCKLCLLGNYNNMTSYYETVQRNSGGGGSGKVSKLKRVLLNI